MILDELISVKITKKNLEHYLNYNKDIKLQDIIKIDPKNLQKSSNQIVNVACDICKTGRSIKYQAYYKNINSCPEHSIYTCDKCSHIKIKAFNRKKWGVDYYSQTEEYVDKFKKTMIERWGVEWALQSDELKNKVKQTNLEKFGFENPFMNVSLIRTKFKEKWGVDHPSQVPEFVEKISIAAHKSWQDKESRLEKFKKTNLQNWGKSHFTKSDLFRNYQLTQDNNYISYIDTKSVFKCDLGSDHDFKISSSEYHNRKRSVLPLCTICYPIGDSKSIKENELYNFIKSVYPGEIIQSWRDGLEIDVYLPEIKLGFEFNGLYWHSDIYKDKWYHLNKTNYFKEMGIRIIHIWEDDWINKTEILQSQIKNWIGKTANKVYARECEVKEIKQSQISKEFLEKNHIQGGVNSVLKLGLFKGKELLSVMTFDHYEGRKRMSDSEWNINRFCNKLDYNVIGSASKIFAYFKKNYNLSRIISYADKDWSIGTLYEKLGFNLVKETDPDYKYILENKRIHKSRFRKSRLRTSLTENDFMKQSHISKIWDCGKIKFEINY
jgi:hypothetical protein